MRTNPFIITLTGSSGCGKTYFTDRIIEFADQLKNNSIHFKPRRHWKYVTRQYRESELIDRKLLKKEIDVRSVRNIPNDCEFVYRTYGDEYGFKKKDLQNYLDRGECPIIVVNDVRVVEELKKEFPDTVLSLFLFREIIPDVESHKRAGESRGGVSENKIISRFEKAVALYRIFIENIFLFDRVILNVPYEGIDAAGQVFEDLAKIQAHGVIRSVLEEKILLNKKIAKSPKLFIVSGNAQSGKDDIIRAAKKLGKIQTDILLKYTTRWEEDGDEGEIICKYIPRIELINKYNEDYKYELENFKKAYNLKEYKRQYGSELKKKFEETKGKFASLNEFIRIKYELEKLAFENNIKTGIERFWLDLKEKIEACQISDVDNPENKSLSESSYRKILSSFFQTNESYIDLDEIAKIKKNEYQAQIQKIEQKIKEKKENNSAAINYGSKHYVLYENNKKVYSNPIYYGFEIDHYLKLLQNSDKHLVLSASLPNIFNICREFFGQENVVTVYTYSQISKEEHARYSNNVTGAAKIQEYDDILRYAYHIADFDYALIYAETSLVNKQGNQKDELVDQMFRLFRTYNLEKNKIRNKLIVLAGPSASGKSSIVFKLSEAGLCKIAPKYSNREKRKFQFDDITSVKDDYIKSFCNIINYEMYGNLYGFNLDEIKNGLINNSIVAICSDIDSIKKFNKYFERNVAAIYIYLQEVSIEHLIKTFLARKGITSAEKGIYVSAKRLTKLVKTGNDIQLQTEEISFLNGMKTLLGCKDYDEFVQRYISLLHFNDSFIKNKSLFNYVVSGESIDQLTENCIKIVKNLSI